MLQSRKNFAGWAPVLILLFAGCELDFGIVEPEVSAEGVAASVAVTRFSAWSAPVNLGSTVNSPYVDFTPEISKDGLSLYFGSNRPGGYGANDLWVSRRSSTDDPWGPPVNLGPVINSEGNEAAPNISRDGHHLFFTSTRPGGLGSNDIWVSWRRQTHDDLGWEAPVNLGSPVNTPSFDAGASLLRPEFYFTSNVASGGALDVYVSRVRGNGSYGPPVLVTELSSEGNDQRPSIRFDGKEIFLSSNRDGAALQDIWVSTRRSKDVAWSAPVSLGPVINSDAFDQQPAISGDGTMLFFSSTRPGGSGLLDLYVAVRILQPR